METQLAQNLLTLAAIYGAAKRIEETTVGRHIASDGKFFVRIRDGETTFTVKKYDEVVNNFSKNWPDGVRWPSSVLVPSPKPRKEARSGVVV
ncbi:hypothetical protein DKP76_13495 [Falsochrobactrum shanghaiense]|uniref:Uncharacterized protein n=1 Tax=Falsochrobactrum shanghaiense TaxID=2201899 RepID=A0A316J6W4_9HYPH|nr:hypothetical protein [Falsochrobactrum shanghaiense]PWL17046.1 hypothetical protein DKP76_13495 [Falsochrobactrum shanghaiense]